MRVDLRRQKASCRATAEDKPMVLADRWIVSRQSGEEWKYCREDDGSEAATGGLSVPEGRSEHRSEDPEDPRTKASEARKEPLESCRS